MPEPVQPKTSGNRDPALDGLRGMAVLLVFLFHYGGGMRAHNPLLRFLGYVTQAGWIGVDIFFALSGYLITAILLQSIGERDALRNFYFRRALRILPLYFATLLTCGVAALLAGTRIAGLKPLGIYLFFLQNLPPLLQRSLHTLPPLPVYHLWSLAVEEQFYLLWPLGLLWIGKPRRRLNLCLGVFVTSCVFRAVIFFPHLLPDALANSFAVFLPTRAGALALGCALAVYRGSKSSPGSAGSGPLASTKVLGVVAMVALLAILLTGRYTHTYLLNNRRAFVFMLPAADVLSAALVAFAVAPGAFRRALRSAGLPFLGRISYGFYVLHVLLEPLFDRLGTLLTHSSSGFPYQAARLLAAFPVTIAAASISFVALERPFLQLKGHFRPAPDELSTQTG